MKKIVRIAGVILLSGLIGFLAYTSLKPADFVVKITAESSTGNTFQEIKAWSLMQKNLQAEIIQEDRPKLLSERLNWEGNTYETTWEIQGLNDTISEIRMLVSSENNSFVERLKMPFTQTETERDGTAMGKAFFSSLQGNLQRFKTRVEGEETSPDLFCACTRAKSFPEQKAYRMMQDYNYLSEFVEKNEITMTGFPLVKVNRFEPATNEIVFDFCFPIEKRADLPVVSDIYYREIPSFRGLKAIFNGNYLHSNRAWYTVQDYAANRNIELDLLPLEIYHDNPNFGGNELQWTTEIYIPIKGS